MRIRQQLFSLTQIEKFINISSWFFSFPSLSAQCSGWQATAFGTTNIKRAVACPLLNERRVPMVEGLSPPCPVRAAISVIPLVEPLDLAIPQSMEGRKEERVRTSGCGSTKIRSGQKRVPKQITLLLVIPSPHSFTCRTAVDRGLKVSSHVGSHLTAVRFEVFFCWMITESGRLTRGCSWDRLLIPGLRPGSPDLIKRNPRSLSSREWA